MKPRKSLDLEFPDLPKEYLRDFVRGVFGVLYEGVKNKLYLERKFNKLREGSSWHGRLKKRQKI